jgi:hypothetical protein
MHDEPTAPFEPASQQYLDQAYGPGVSGVLRSRDFPQELRSFFVQAQVVEPEQTPQWETLAVYESSEAAERYVRRRETPGTTIGKVDTNTGEFTPLERQPVIEHRVVTLVDLIREGPGNVARAVLDLVTSDCGRAARRLRAARIRERARRARARPIHSPSGSCSRSAVRAILFADPTSNETIHS